MAAAWKCIGIGLLVLLAASSTLSSGEERETQPTTLQSLMIRLVENIPFLKQALLTPRPQHALERSSNVYQDMRHTSGSGQKPAPEQQCFEDLGCLITGSDFYSYQYRPINVMVEARQVLQVTFNVHTREDPKRFAVPALNVSRLHSSSFRPERSTKFVIHGYLNGRDMPWLEELVAALLEAGDFNVVYVDWTGGSLGVYNQAVANARLAALELARFIKYARVVPAHVHLIGHSLGAHVAGYVGDTVEGLGRITGLDPAEPLFQFMPPSVRLDPSDALLVDVIHTDAGPFALTGGYGAEQAMGHLDFYPNGGENQPGCKPPLVAPITWLMEKRNFTTVWEAVEDSLGCNHIRAVELFLDSIRSQCPYIAFPCPSFYNFNRGECFSCGADGSGCISMGLHAASWQSAAPLTTGEQLYLATGPLEALCVHHYRAMLEVGGNTSVAEGYLQLSIPSPSGQVADFDVTNGNPQTFVSGQSRTFLLQHSEDLGTALSAHLTWTCYRHRICSPGPLLTRLTLLNIEKFIQRRHSRQLGYGPSQITFCTTEETPIMSGETRTLPTCQTSHHSPWQSTS